MELKSLLETATQASYDACDVIMDVYQSKSFEEESKNDNSPLTKADKQAHQAIAAALASTGIPLLSEEGKEVPYEQRRHWEYFWLVDPLDGTKEFIRRNGEFTVNVALIHRQRPVIGVVAVPVTRQVYFAYQNGGAYLLNNGNKIALPRRSRIDLKMHGLRVIASRSHLNEETQNFINQLASPELISKGSSLKFMLQAEGLADVYPRFAPTMEWDTAAADCIISESGLQIVQTNSGDVMLYNKESLLNPSFLCY